LPRDLDVCLERARVQEETDPSPEVQSLLASLIQRQARMTDLSRHRAIWQDGPPPPDNDRGVSSYDTGSSVPPTSPDLLGNEPDGSVGPDDLAPPPPQQEGGDPYEAPPDSAQQDATPPDLQGNPSDTGPDDDGSRPANQHDHATHPPHGS
jgi:hypothetical protein